MNCPKCKKEIADDAVRCPYCNVRVNMYCPKCRTLNRFGSLSCSNCGTQFIIYCPQCQKANLSSAKTCRKCGYVFPEQIKTDEASKDVSLLIAQKDEVVAVTEKKSIENFDDELKEEDSICEKNIKSNEDKNKILNDDINLEDEIADVKKYSIESAIKKLVFSVIDPDKRVISICAPDGFGKSTVIKNAISKFSSENNEINLEFKKVTFLFGKCSAISQVSPFGFIQEVLLSYFKLPNYCGNVDEFIKLNKEFFQSHFQNLLPNEILDLINFLYPSKTSYYENIIENKNKIFSLFEKVFISLAGNEKLYIVVDDIQFIDQSSFEFLSKFLGDSQISTKICIIITSNVYQAPQTYFVNLDFDDNAFEMINLEKISKNKFITFINTKIARKSVLQDKVFDFMYGNFDGNLFLLEHFLNYLEEKNLLISEGNTLFIKLSDNEIFSKLKNFALILNSRLEILAQKNSLFIDILNLASILGYNFSVRLIENILRINQEEIEGYLDILQKEKFIISHNKHFYSFISLSEWQIIFENAKMADNYEDLNYKILSEISQLTMSSSAISAILAQNNKLKEDAFHFWTQTMKYCACIGDVNLYCTAQHQCLKIISDVNSIDKNLVYNNINERVGKLLYKSMPEQAIEYLANTLKYTNENKDIVKQIDAASYFIKACELSGKYYGIIECVDMINSSLDLNYAFEKAIFNSKKLSALFYIGNIEEVIQIAQNDILPQLESALSLSQKNSKIPLSIIFEVWLNSSLYYALALSLQGNDKVLEVINNVVEAININKIQNVSYYLNIMLSKALHYSLKGQIDESNNILNDISHNYFNEKIENFVVIKWNLISVLNRVIVGDLKNLESDLFSISVLLNNLNDEFGKNLIKCVLGYCFEKKQNANKAMAIYNEQILYFSKEKNATGAIICWYLIARLNFNINGTDKALEIAQKALEIALNSKINNIFFIVLLEELIAEIYLAKNDLDASKMYIEKAILLSKKYDLQMLQAQLYVIYSKYIQELLLISLNKKSQLAKKVIAFLSHSLKIVSKLNLDIKINEYTALISEFKTYCQLNKINIK